MGCRIHQPWASTHIAQLMTILSWDHFFNRVSNVCGKTMTSYTSPIVLRPQICAAVHYIANWTCLVLTALDAGCVQQPPAGVLIGLNGTVFSKNQVGITSPSKTPATSSTKHKVLTIGAIIGIAVGGGVLAIILIAVIFVCLRKHRNNNRLKQLRSPLDARFGASNISAPNRGAFASPKSSPPLKSDSLPMKTVSRPKHLNLTRQVSQRTNDWYDPPSEQTPTTGISPAPPVYSPPNSSKPLLSVHNVSIPPQYSPPARNSTSPGWIPPPPPPRPASLHQGLTPPTRAPYESTRPPHVRSGSAMSNTSRAPPVRSSSTLSNTTRSPPAHSFSTRSPPVSMSNTTKSPPENSISGRSPPTMSINTRSPPVTSTTPATAASYIDRSASNASRNHNRDLSLARERAGTPVNQISGPIIQVGNRFEDEDEARRARERLYREGLPGLGNTMVRHADSKEIEEGVSPESMTSEEQWPGTY